MAVDVRHSHWPRPMDNAEPTAEDPVADTVFIPRSYTGIGTWPHFQVLILIQ